MIQQSVLVTLTIFVAGLIYAAGRQRERLENQREKLVEMRADWKAEVAALRAEIAELREMLRAAISERRNWREHDGG